jgi:hypothetical protein
MLQSHRSFNFGFWILDDFGFWTNLTPYLEIKQKRNKFSNRLNFSAGGSPIDWLQSALKIRRTAKFSIKFWGF